MAFKGRQMWKIWLLKLFVLIISSPYKRQSNILLVVIQNLGQGGRKGDVLAFHPYGSSFGCQCKKTNQPNKQTKPTKPTNQPKIKPPHSIYSNYIITIIKIITNCGVTALESIFFVQTSSAENCSDYCERLSNIFWKVKMNHSSMFCHSRHLKKQEHCLCGCLNYTDKFHWSRYNFMWE